MRHASHSGHKIKIVTLAWYLKIGKVPGPMSGTGLKPRFSSFRNSEFENLVVWAF